jgi:hypothetical protein
MGIPSPTDFLEDFRVTSADHGEHERLEEHRKKSPESKYLEKDTDRQHLGGRRSHLVRGGRSRIHRS